MGRLFSLALQRLATFQVRSPWRVLALGALLSTLAALLASRLELRTRFDQLLPEHEPSVVELQRVAARTAGQSNVFVVLEGTDSARLRAFGDALVVELRALGAPWVASAEDGVQSSREFLEPRAGLFAATPDLQKLHDDVEARWQWEVGEETGTNLDGDEPPPVTAEQIRKQFGAGDVEKTRDRFPGGYYQSKAGTTLVVVARSSVASGDLAGARAALARVQAVVAELGRAPLGQGIHAGYAGDLVTGLAEYGAVRADLVGVGVLGLALVLAVVFLFYMRVRALVAMGLTIAAGLAWTFGATELAIGHLNVATGFLFSIVAGNGINFGIIYMARYFEERRPPRSASPAEALRVAHEETWPSTVTAAVAAAAAYGSLWVTDFRAFKHFAFIGGFGMVACWVATYTLLPAILVLYERVLPFARGDGRGGWFSRLRMRGLRYDQVFAALVQRAPRTIAVTGVALALAGATVLVPYVKSGPMEYDMRRLQNDVGQSAEMYRLSRLASDILGANLEGAMVVALDRFDQIEPFVHALDERRAAAPAESKPFEAVHSILDFVPSKQAEKIPVLLDLRARILRAHDRGSISEADWAEIAPLLPPEDLRAFGVDDLPEDTARPFTEKDGRRGLLVAIEPTAGKSDADLRYLLRWADSFRETRLPNGDLVRGSGRAVIFADMLRSVVRDIPKCIALSLAMTIIAVGITFRRGVSSSAVLASLAIGVGWVVLGMFAADTRIHFLNFIALPITFGIGVDYAVNVVQRYDAERARLPEGDGKGASILDALRHTGGAVVLCSLTTTLGYLALLRSTNQAIRGLGLLAVTGEVACLLAAVLVLPAALLWFERSRVAGVADDASAGAARPTAARADHPRAA
jgi:predicted RND superfamily exporter protein